MISGMGLGAAAYFHGLSESRMLVVLTETLFIDNKMYA